ncbi:MAG: hypothetical protein V9E82_12345 [Candidatus Nanopelagicales bacterium]
MRRAVEAVTADPVLCRHLPIDRVEVGGLGHGLVERGVEHRDVRHARIRLHRDLDPEQVRRVVQRSQRDAVADGLDHLGVDHRGGRETVATMHDAVSHRGQRPGGHLHRGLEGLCHRVQPRAVVGQGAFDDVFEVAAGVGHPRDSLPDPLDEAAGQRAGPGHVDQFVLDARRA